MAKFLLRGRYTARALQGTVREGFAAREQYIRQIGELMHSHTEAVYWSYGDDHFFVLLEMPDGVAAAARTLASNLTGATDVRTTPLLTSEEMDAAVALMPEYRAPAA